MTDLLLNRRFSVLGVAYTMTEMLAANRYDDDLCAWLRAAKVGDEYTDGECCVRLEDAQPEGHSADVRTAIQEANDLVDKAWRLPNGGIPTRSQLRAMIGTPGDDEANDDDGARAEYVEQASIGAAALVDDLAHANVGAPALLSLALLPLIARAAQLRADIAAVRNAIGGA